MSDAFKIEMKIDVKDLEENYKFTEKNVVYAVVNAINDTVRQVQKREQDNVRQKFHLRGGAGENMIMKNIAKIKPFASVGRGTPYAEIFIDDSKRGSLLSKLETGGVKTSLFGGNVAVPVTGLPARPSFDSPVPGNLYITKLNLKPQLSGAENRQRLSLKGATRKDTARMRREFVNSRSVGAIRIGEQSTYQIPGLGVFQRLGPKKRDTKMIYKFKPNPPLKPMIGFQQLAESEGQAMLQYNLDREIEKTLAHKLGR